MPIPKFAPLTTDQLKILRFFAVNPKDPRFGQQVSNATSIPMGGIYRHLYYLRSRNLIADDRLKGQRHYYKITTYGIAYVKAWAAAEDAYTAEVTGHGSMAVPPVEPKKIDHGAMLTMWMEKVPKALKDKAEKEKEWAKEELPF